MFFEKCGKLFFSQIRPLFFFVLLCLPLACAALFLFFQYTEIQNLESRFANSARKAKIALQRKDRRERFLIRYSQVNPYFLDEEIESFSLLQNEKQRLELLLNHPAFPNHQLLKERLSFLAENRLAFAETNIRTSAQVKEVEEKQRHPVQMDEEDLKQILLLIEDLPSESSLASEKRPQIVIKDFRLRKQQTHLQTGIFEVDMELLKREFMKL
jgi:hypothetical protein